MAKPLTRRADEDLESRPQCPVCVGTGYSLMEVWLVQAQFRQILDYLMAYVAICRRCGLRLPLTLEAVRS